MNNSHWINYTSTHDQPPFTPLSNFSRNNPMPASGYTFSADPLMDINPYNSNQGPLRMYCVGVTYNSDASPQTAPNAIALWHADQPSYGFSTPTIVDSRYSSISSQVFLDKPAVAVSWHQGYPINDLGYVYVAYVSADFTNRNTAIMVARSTNGGVSFQTMPPIAYGGDPNPPPTQPIQVVQDPQVIVETNGAVHVLWVDFGANQIQMATSTDQGATFGVHEVVASGTMATPRTAVNALRYAVTAPMARYDSVGNSIVVVWHDLTANGLDVEYAFKDNNGWHRPSQPIVQFTANDQFFPAIDFNTSGNVVVTYYDRHADVNNIVYRPYQAYLYYFGQRIDAVDHDMAGFDSDPRSGNPFEFIGDYQTVWDWPFVSGERAMGSSIGIVNTIYDNYLSTISY